MVAAAAGRPLSNKELHTLTAPLLAVAGLKGEFILERLSGGANNRGFCVTLDGGRVFLKVYFQHPDDPRDRLGAEFCFSRFAWEHGVRCLPQPLAWDPEHGLGLYEFIEGRRLLPHEVTAEVIQQALAFYQDLNRHKHQPMAGKLPEASEACFTLADHLACVERRVSKLRTIERPSAIEREASVFVEQELVPAWQVVAEAVHRRVQELGLAEDAELPRGDRCLSPSDFGFHNALLAHDGRLRFLDFEYAGWDDPAKLVCDFFCQPAVPVPLDYCHAVVEAVVADLSQPEPHRQRIALLLPVYRLKWCCILLNDFLPLGSARRRFAGSVREQEERKAGQLQKARQALQEVRE